MPRGIPKNGVRKPRISKIASKSASVAFQAPTVYETEAQIDERINDRFEILEDLAKAAIKGDVRAMIVSGPPGLGKSFIIQQELERWDPNGLNHTIVKGYVKATGLLRLLFAHKEAGKVIVFDDADTIFFDDTSLNLLKAVCDSTPVRRVSYMAEGTMLDEDTGEAISKKFEFKGTIVFITNYDFDAMIDKGHRLAPHLGAMISRAHYIDLTMKTKQDYLVRIKQVLKKGLLTSHGLSSVQQYDVVKFIEDNQNSMRELSLRMVLKVADVRKLNSARWEKMAKATCCR